MIPTLYIIVPCYNEEKVLPVTSRMFSEKIGALIGNGKISEASKVLFVNDGSRDNTWKIITELTETDAEEQYGLALELEEYIISRGRENKHLDEALLPCEKIRLDFYWRNRDKEWSLRKQAWLFPSREYMVQFFPILEKYPFLLAFCWIIRNFRFMRRICLNKFKRMKFRIRIRLSDMKEKLKGMMNRDNQEKTPEQLPENDSGEIAGDPSGEIPQTGEQEAKSDENGSVDDAANLEETEGEKKVEEFEDQN